MRHFGICGALGWHRMEGWPVFMSSQIIWLHRDDRRAGLIRAYIVWKWPFYAWFFGFKLLFCHFSPRFAHIFLCELLKIGPGGPLFSLFLPRFEWLRADGVIFSTFSNPIVYILTDFLWNRCFLFFREASRNFQALTKHIIKIDAKIVLTF